MILAARKIDIEQDDRGHDSDHSDGMISCEDLAEHRDAYDGRHDRLRKGKHSSLTGFHMGKAGGVQEEWSQGGNESQQQRMKYCKAAGGRHSSDFANMTERKQRERCDHKCVEGHGQLAVFFYGNASENAVKTIAQTRSETRKDRLPGDRNSSGPATDQTSDKSTSSYCKHKGDSFFWSEFFTKNKAGQDHNKAGPGVEQSACDGQCAQGDAEKIAYVEERDAGNAGSQEHPQISQVDPKKRAIFVQDDDQKTRGSDQASQFCDLDRIKSHASQCIGKQSNDPPQAAGCQDAAWSQEFPWIRI